MGQIKSRRRQPKDRQFRQTKAKSAQYFASLLLALRTECPLPRRPHFESSYVQNKIDALTAEIVQIYADQQ
jgi:hypothetical protein